MGDDTYILIKQELNSHYYITLRDIDDDEMIDDLGVEYTLKDAVRMANKFISGCNYGLKIKLEDEKHE